MTFKLKSVLVATGLMALAGYSAAQEPAAEQSTTDESVVITGEHSTDSELRAEVIRRIDEKPALGTENVDVQSFDHKVYLYGGVSSRMDSEEAEDIARTVPGVKKVYNGLGTFGA